MIWLALFQPLFPALFQVNANTAPGAAREHAYLCLPVQITRQSLWQGHRC